MLDARTLAVLPPPPLTLASVPLAVFDKPPLTLDEAPLAALCAPPLTLASWLLAVFDWPPLTLDPAPLDVFSSPPLTLSIPGFALKQFDRPAGNAVAPAALQSPPVILAALELTKVPEAEDRPTTGGKLMIRPYY